MQANIRVLHESRYLREGTWEWAIWLDGSDEELNSVDHVVYTLHRSFPNPVRTVSDRPSKFRLEAIGWGSFQIYVEVVYRDNRRIDVEHDLVLLYPEESTERTAAVSISTSLIERIKAPTPKRLLAIDGGGVRSIMSIEILAKLEQLLRQRLNRADLVLANYFDYVAGTSTGAIVAACVASGMTVDSIRQSFIIAINEMFDKASLLKRFRHKYEATKFSDVLKMLFGLDTTLGSDKLRTLLMMVLQNATSDAAWFVTNNPFEKYNDAARPDSNLNLPLWQLVRASAASPVFFPPEVIRTQRREWVIVDGGLTGFDNPAFQLFLRATAEPYHVRWPVGEDKLLLVSIGSGWASNANTDLQPDEMNLVYNATTLPSTLLSAFRHEQDLLCRMFGRCLSGEPLDQEVGDMIGISGPVNPKLFTYLRYDAELTRSGLEALGLNGIEPKNVQILDSVDYLAELQEIGRALALRAVKPEHYAGFDL